VEATDVAKRMRGSGQAAATSVAPTEATVLLLRDIAVADVATLLARFGLRLQRVADGEPIPGSYWGEPEAGIIGATVHARGDTPVHSLLHEASHLIVLDPAARAVVHTDATDSIAEEDAVCVLQSLLGGALPGVGAERVLADMDAWGYTFRLGSAGAYVASDAESAWQWLADRGLLDDRRRLLFPTPPPDLHPPAASTSLR
jgi:hypothetical protein